MEAFSVTECMACIGIGFLMAGLLFYPLAALLVVIKAFKST